MKTLAVNMEKIKTDEATDMAALVTSPTEGRHPTGEDVSRLFRDGKIKAYTLSKTVICLALPDLAGKVHYYITPVEGENHDREIGEKILIWPDGEITGDSLYSLERRVAEILFRQKEQQAALEDRLKQSSATKPRRKKGPSLRSSSLKRLNRAEEDKEE
jgi:hypothetical protein